MRLKIITFLMIAFFITPIFSEDINIQKVDDFVSYIENNDRGVGSVSIFKNGNEIYNRSFGQKKLNNVKYNNKTKYQIGSITKMITATLVFKLVEQNKLSLDEKLSKFFPEIPNSQKITIKNLLEHSSGLGDYAIKDGKTDWLTKKVSKKEILKEIIKQGTAFEPGTDTKYSNSGYFLLTQIVEQLFKKDYAKIVKNEIAKPLRVKNFESITRKTKNTFASFEYNVNKNEWQIINDLEYSNAIGVGDIVSTTKDLNIILYNLFQYKILKKESIEQMIPNIAKKEMLGRGFMLIPFYSNVFYGHAGDTFGTHSMVAYNEKDGLGICYSINGERFPHNDFAVGILSIIYGKDYEYPNFDTIVLKSEELDKFTGMYSSPKLPIKINITKEGNTLKCQGTGQPSFYLECYEINKFKFDQANLKIEFIPEENKMILNQFDMQFELTKE